MGKKRKTKKKKKRRKKGGGPLGKSPQTTGSPLGKSPQTTNFRRRFPGLGKKIKEILDKQKELNGRLHNIEQFYPPMIANLEKQVDSMEYLLLDLGKREGLLRSYINFNLAGHDNTVQGDPYDAEFETSVGKWAKHIDSHEGEDRADIHDYMQGGRKRKSRRKRRKRTRKR